MAKSAKAKAKKATKRAKPRTPALPGMEDHAIRPLESVARRYAEIRDERQELTREEVALKASAKTLMHKHGKTVYKHGGVSIRLIPGEEGIKVKVSKPGEDDDTPMDVTDAGEDDGDTSTDVA